MVSTAKGRRVHEVKGALMSIRPKYAREILDGSKTVELRRRAPGCLPGEQVIIYETSPRKAIVGSARVREIQTGTTKSMWKKIGSAAGVSKSEYSAYLAGSTYVVAIHLDSIQTFEEPLFLHSVREMAPDFRPPQSWCYLENLPSKLLVKLRSLSKSTKR